MSYECDMKHMGERRKAYKIWFESQGRISHLEDLGIDGRKMVTL
jgi:hypothetical protein